MYFRDRIISHVVSKPNDICVVFNDKSFTWEQFNKRVNSCIYSLNKIGLKKGDHFAVCSLNCHQYRELFAVAAKGGFAIIPLNYRLSVKEKVDIINDSESKAVFLGEEYLSLYQEKEKLPLVQHFVSLGSAKEGLLNYEDLVASGKDDEPEVDLKDDDILWLWYTSGTTGRPKGVVHTQKTVSAFCKTADVGRNVLRNMKPDQSEAWLMFLPMSSFGGGAVDQCFFWGGMKTILLERYDAEKILKSIQENRVTHLHLVPTVMAMLMSHPDASKYDLSSLREITYGGSPVSKKNFENARKFFGNILVQDYGSTEGGVICWMPQSGHDPALGGKEKRISSCGVPCQGVEVRIVDSEGNDVPSGVTGEIIVRSDQVMKGYWKMPDQTEEVLKNGWLYTGDMGYKDEDGYFYITDRKKDMIISGGLNIYPSEVENTLSQHPAVLQSAVIGIPDDLWGESVHALVMLKPGAKVTAQELIDFCQDNIASYKKPKSIEIVESLPLTASGKVLKREIRDKYWVATGRKI